MSDNRDKLMPMLEKLGIRARLKSDDLALSGKPLMKRVMQTWLPAHEVRGGRAAQRSAHCARALQVHCAAASAARAHLAHRSVRGR